MKKLGIVASQFPEMHETFVIRELRALLDAGIEIQIYSLKKCRDRIHHKEAEPLLPLIQYVAWNDLGIWCEGVAEFAKHPLRGISTFKWVLAHQNSSIPHLIKSLVVWIQAMAIARRMKNDAVTHIHAHWATMPTTAALVISRWLGIPFSFSAHAWDIFVPNPSLKQKVKETSCVFTCTDYNRRYLQNLVVNQREKIILSYHGVDLSQFKHEKDDGKNKNIFLTVGRFVETKGYDDLLESYRRLNEQGIAFHAVIVGSGPLRPRIIRKIKQFGLSGKVELRSSMKQDGIRELYKNTLAFVLPCVVAENGDRDGIPNVVAEAMAMGCPVVSTSISGIPEVIKDRQTGLLVPSEDVERLSDALRLLLEDRQLAETLGMAGRRWVEENFSASDHLNELVAHVKQMLAEPEENKAKGSVLLRVAYVIWSLDKGGAEQVVVNLAKKIDRQSFCPVVVCLNKKGRYAQEVEKAGIKVFELHKKPKFDPSVILKLISIFKSEKINLVHTHLFTANLWGRIAAKLAGIPVVSTEHNEDIWKNNLHLTADRLLSAVNKKIVFVSKSVKAFYESKLPGLNGKSQVLYNGIDLERLCVVSDRTQIRRQFDIDPEAEVIGIVGRLVPQKAHADFIDAIGYLRKAGRNVIGLIVGDGELRSMLEKKVQENGLQDSIVFAGFCAEISALYQAMDIFVLPSLREGFPMTILEAMTFGVPVVAAEVGGVGECITNGRDGLLVPPGKPADLAEAVQKLLEDQNLRETIVRNARQKVNDYFTVEKMADAHSALYLEVLAS